MKRPLRHLTSVTLFTITIIYSFQSVNPDPPLTKTDGDATIQAAFLKQRGVCWVAMPHPIEKSDFQALLQNNIQWINQTPFAFQREHDSPELKFFTDENVWWGERDIGIETTTAMAKELGIKSVLKPHIWLHSNHSGKWRAEIGMKNEEDWQKWFAAYRKFILHHAKLAQKNGIELFCVGTELLKTVKQREEDWRQLIRDVRQIYNGKLTYAANWYQEFEMVPFWDHLDFIGIQAYFPLTDQENPTLQDLLNGWKPHLIQIEKIQQKFSKPVIFTEIGYKNDRDAAIHPWKWNNTNSDEDTSGLETQAACYEAFFRIFWEKDWFAGVYFWKWFPNPEKLPHLEEKDFTPQLRPAEKILAKWFAEE
jgi:hypothetical protein